MELKEIRKNAQKMLATFIDEIGLNGEFYASLCNCPMMWGRPLLDSPGEFLSPASERLESILQTSKYDEKIKETLNRTGLILINQNYKQKEPDSDLFVTAIHETLHSNRNLLIFDATRDNKNENAYSYSNGKFEQNTSEYNFTYADASQEILKGSIDTSKKIVNTYKNVSSEQIEDLDFVEGKRDSQMEKQQIVDEALVELMSVLSYKLYSNKEKSESTDIWKIIEKASTAYEGDDISAICKIILKHHDFDLFYWMLDPITYSYGDIHFDFFGEYTKDDQDLVYELYESAGLDMDDILESTKTTEINIDDIKEIATSPTAIEELSKIFQSITHAQNVEKEID